MSHPAFIFSSISFLSRFLSFAFVFSFRAILPAGGL
jgi:hypothetical protein